MRTRSVAFLLFGAFLGSTVHAQSPSPSLSSGRPASWRYASEQEWIVSDVVSTLARLCSRMRSTPLGDVRVSVAQAGPSLRAVVAAADGTTSIDVRDHIWAPANYVPLAKQWAGRRLPRAPQTSASGALSALTTPTVRTLEAANLDLARRLSAPSPDRGDYDDAALLAGVMALREAPGPFSDVRHLLSTMTAYLAMADAGGAPATKSGRVAAVIALALVDRQRDALDQLEAWEKQSPSVLEETWIRALTLRVTGDWRQLQRPQSATLLERVEYVRALEMRLGPSAVLDFLDASHPEDVVDWARIGLFRTSVESGGRFNDEAIGGELGDAVAVWSKISGQSGTQKELVTAVLEHLNDDAPASGPDAAPIDWPTWAASMQRHLVADVAAAVEHESNRLGARDAAREVASNAEQAFGRLTMFPLAKLHYALDDLQHVEAMRDVVGLMQRRPELLTSALWITALAPRNGRAPTNVVPQSTWFTSLEPAGTAYDADNRVYTYWKTNHLTLPALQAVRSVAPFSRYLIEEEMRWRYFPPLVPALDTYQRAASLIADFDAGVLADLATSAKGDPAAYESIAARLCRLQASACDLYAKFLAAHDRGAEAARVFEQWIAGTRDQVAVANGVNWLVTYDYEHGDTARAIALADKAAEVYSYRGLKTKARLLERMGNYRDAESVLKKASERYNRTDDLTAFYARWSKTTDDAGVKTATDALVANVFPNGLSAIDVTTLSGAPADGNRLTTVGERGEQAGFAVGDVIVGIDGIRVRNYDQLYLAWHMSASPDIAFVVWKGAKYVTVRAPIRESWDDWYVNTVTRAAARRTEAVRSEQRLTKAYEDVRFKVSRLRWERGNDTPATYDHAGPVVVVFLGDGMLQTSAAGPVEAHHRGEVKYVDAGIDVTAGTLVSGDRLEAVIVELKTTGSARGLQPAALPAAFPRAGAAQVLDNDRVAVWDAAYPSGEQQPSLLHAHNAIRVWIEGTTLERAVPEQPVQRLPRQEGTWELIPAGMAASERAIDHSGRAITVELK